MDCTGIETPFYLYDTGLLERTLGAACDASSRFGYELHYAVKANHQPEVLARIAARGLGADCVSGGEVAAAMDAGFRPGSIVFAGVGKTDEEIVLALENRVGCIHCESLQELEIVAGLARQMGHRARVALRVNPEVDAQTHRLITTGLAENKFGIPLTQLQPALEICKREEALVLEGLHFHIGSQILEEGPFVALCRKASDIWREFRLDAHGAMSLNLGGGLGIHYEDPRGHPVPDFHGFFSLFDRHLQVPPQVKIRFEPGRSIVGQCASLITRVLFVKEGIQRLFLVVDAGMTELLRPALYQARHHIDNLSSRAGVRRYHVVGPACETTDSFGTDVSLPLARRGDLLAIRSCGAYGQSMSLRYNLRREAPAYYYEENPFPGPPAGREPARTGELSPAVLV
jgi:diaminopimelate decarboxylase